MTLSAQALTKRYGTAAGHEAVRDASLELEAGEFVSIVGRSGSGKSTLMAMLGALTKPTEGRLLLDGTDVWTLSEAELATFRSRRIGFIFQFPSLLSNLTAVDNVAVPALLGRTMDAGQAYARAYDLLARVGLRDRADAYPAACPAASSAASPSPVRSSIRRRCCSPTSRPAISTKIPRPTSSTCSNNCSGPNSFGFVLVTHNLELAKRARRTYEMRQGVLAATDLPRIAVDPERPRHFGPAKVDAPADLALPAAAVVSPIRLGSGLWRGVQIFLLAGAVIFGGILLADFGIDKYQKMRVRQRDARVAALQHLALNSLRGDVQSVTDLGDGRYELTTYLQNVGGSPIYVMAPDLRAYVQVKTVWQEVPMKPIEDAASGVLKIEGKQTYRYLFDARVRDYTQLLAELHACPFFRHDAGQSEQHAQRRRIRAQGQLLRLPQAVRYRRRGGAQAHALFGETAGVDPDAAPLRC